MGVEAPSPPAGARRVLIVEDEALVAMLLEDMLDDAGHRAVFCASSLRQALDYIERDADSFDFARPRLTPSISPSWT